MIWYESKKCKELINEYFVNHKSENKYFEDFGCFDIETTNEVYINEQLGTQPIMYLWQFQLGESTILGRKWADYVEFINEIKAKIGKNRNKNPNYRYIIFVHNLFFESSFIDNIYNFSDEVVFKRGTKTYSIVDGAIEYRCSSLLSDMPLEEFTKGCEHAKRPDYDYDKVRFPWDELNEQEIEYAVNDVLGLREAIIRLMRLTKTNIQTLPLTQRGFIMLELKDMYNKSQRVSNECGKFTQQPICGTASQFSDSYVGKINHPTKEQYKYIREASHGGNTCPARKYRSAYLEGETQNIILQNVVSQDAGKFYPSIMIQRDFPVGKWQTYNNITLSDLSNFSENGFAWVARLIFVNLRLKNPEEPIPYLQHTMNNKIATKNVNWYLDKRVDSAEQFSCTLTDVDFSIVLRQYDFDEIITSDCITSKYGQLPRYIKELIMKKYFELVKMQKGTIEYNINKANLNSLAGKAGRERAFDERKGTEKSDAQYNVERSWDLLPYPWFVWVTAIGRYILQDCIDKAGDKIVYAAVDSIKTLGTVDLSEHNKDCVAHNHGVATKEEMMSDEWRGIGCFIQEWVAKEFKTIAPGIYAYTTEQPIKISDKDRKWAKETLKLTDKQLDKFNLVITISGVRKDRGALELYARGGLSVLQGGFEFKHMIKKEAEVVIAPYQKVDYEGHELEVCGGVIIREVHGFKLGDNELENMSEPQVYKGIMEVYKDACKKQFF